MPLHLLPVLAALTSLPPRADAAPLGRRADWGFRFAVEPAGVVVRDLRTGSAAAAAGLADGDRVLALDGAPLTGPRQIAPARRAHRGDAAVRLDVRRGDDARAVRFTLPALAEESIPGCRVIYGAVATPRGERVRTVLTLPAGATRPLPTVVFIPWLSCDPVEGPEADDGWTRLLRTVAARSGWALYRVEKPGVGDSEGPDCAQNDLEADLTAFRAALDDVARRPELDPTRLVLFGGSVGAALAPVLAQGRAVAGVIACGGFSRTWLEHMLEIERRRLTLGGAAPAELHRALTGYADFYALYLNGGLTPAQVLARRPDLAPLWYDAPDGQYGRPAAYYQQLQALDVEGAWSALEAPVLVVHGEYDWIMSPAEAEHAAELVEARHPGRATLAVLPRTDHNLERYASPLAAFRHQGGAYDEAAAEPVLRWLAALAQAAPASAGAPPAGAAAGPPAPPVR